MKMFMNISIAKQIKTRYDKIEIGILCRKYDAEIKLLHNKYQNMKSVMNKSSKHIS